MDDDLPEREIEAAEDRPAEHDHAGLDDEALAGHVRAVHGLDAPEHLSPSTVAGLHDRLHREEDALDDPDD